MKVYLSAVSPKGGKVGVKACQKVPSHIKWRLVVITWEKKRQRLP